MARKWLVSTHSRPKAAVFETALCWVCCRSFNTQPPEGGCFRSYHKTIDGQSFNTQPPEGGCFLHCIIQNNLLKVSTHSRPKAAVYLKNMFRILVQVSTHSRPKAAVTTLQHDLARYMVSTHSRPKAAVFFFSQNNVTLKVSTHSRPKAAVSLI